MDESFHELIDDQIGKFMSSLLGLSRRAGVGGAGGSGGAQRQRRAGGRLVSLLARLPALLSGKLSQKNVRLLSLSHLVNTKSKEWGSILARCTQ